MITRIRVLIVDDQTLVRLCWRMTPRIAWGSGSRLTLPTRMQGQAHKVGSTGLTTRSLGQHGVNAHQIDRYGGQDKLHMRFVQAILARTAYPHPPYHFANRAFASCS